MFTMTIHTTGAAFDDDNRDWELRRIIAEVANKVYNGHTEGKLFDINGNQCGEYNVNASVDSDQQPFGPW